MLAHPAGDGVTTSITLSRFCVSYLSIARQFLLFCSATSENSKENKIVTLKWIFTTTKSRLPEVVILRKCLGKPQIRLKLQHIKGVSWLLAGPKAKPPNRVNRRKFGKSLNRRVLEIQTKSNTLNKFSRWLLESFSLFIWKVIERLKKANTHKHSKQLAQRSNISWPYQPYRGQKLTGSEVLPSKLSHRPSTYNIFLFS